MEEFLMGHDLACIIEIEYIFARWTFKRKCGLVLS